MTSTISTDQPVQGDCCQSESDTATCFLGDPQDVLSKRMTRKPSKGDVELASKSLMSRDVIQVWLPSLVMTKEAVCFRVKLQSSQLVLGLILLTTINRHFKTTPINKNADCYGMPIDIQLQIA